MSLGCARCGDCCDPVSIPRDTIDPWTEWLAYWRAGGPDLPTTYMDGEPVGPLDPSLEFIGRHMEPVGESDTHRKFACDYYDPATRLCTAHDARPPMCSNFPFYGGRPGSGAAAMYSRCSYLLDVPVAERPEGARPLIPITVVTR